MSMNYQPACGRLGAATSSTASSSTALRSGEVADLDARSGLGTTISRRRYYCLPSSGVDDMPDVAQISAPSAQSQTRGRPFPKGVSGNPGGRPRGFVQAIREAMGGGRELVEFMLSV